MFARNLLTEEERRVDGDLGYPPGYALLCRNSHDIITPFSHGPPRRFHPYALHPHDIAKVEELNELFPVVECQERDPLLNARRFADSLWHKLDHLGNAGFDPDKFRVDPYGNVLYRNASPASPLAWEVDHWFPHSRGGKTIESNLRLLQWQVNQKKQNKLEFLVPWWDLQLGVSVNQFLSIFSSKNTGFRERALDYMFFGGENEPLQDGHCWPRHFWERKAQIGIAPAAIVKVHRQANVVQSTSTHPAVPTSGTPIRRRWIVEEEEALRRGIQKFGAGNWKEIKETEPLFRSRSAVQIKDKYRQMKGEWELGKENRGDEVYDKELTLSRAVQKESRLKKIKEDELRAKEEEMCRLNRELKELQQQNESECLALEDLESVLIKHRRRVEKQRQWSEAQFSYRMCLEKMIADAMHQSVVYKEQGRLNQAACNALMARLETQKVTCDASEMEFIKRSKQREDIKTKLHEPLTCILRSPECAGTEIVAVADVKETEIQESKERPLPLPERKEECFKMSQKMRSFSEEKRADKCFTFIVSEMERGKVGIETLEVQETGSTRNLAKTDSAKEKPSLSEADDSDLDILIVGYEYGGVRARAREAESVGDNMTLAGSSEFKHSKFQALSKEDCASRIGENNRWNQIFHKTEEHVSCKPVEGNQFPGETIQALEFPGKPKEDITDSNTEKGKEDKEMIRKVVESNLDNCLQKLNLNSQSKEDLQSDTIFPAINDSCNAPQVYESKSIFEGLVRNTSFRHKSPFHKKAHNCRRSEGSVMHLTPIIASAKDMMVAGAPHIHSTDKQVPDCLDLAEKFQSLQLSCDETKDDQRGNPCTSAVREPEVSNMHALQKKEKESILKRSESSVFASLWGMRPREGKPKEGKSTEEDGQHRVTLLNNGFSASLKSYAHIWKKAVKRLEVVVMTTGADHNPSD